MRELRFRSLGYLKKKQVLPRRHSPGKADAVNWSNEEVSAHGVCIRPARPAGDGDRYGTVDRHVVLASVWLPYQFGRLDMVP